MYVVSTYMICFWEKMNIFMKFKKICNKIYET